MMAREKQTSRNGKPRKQVGGKAPKKRCMVIRLLTEVVPVRWDLLKASPENNKLYRPITLDDPDIVALAESIKTHGVREPVVATQDWWILSGHRRHAACEIAGVGMVPCRMEPFRRKDDPDRFLTLLREYNRQRTKNNQEKLREEVISADPKACLERLRSYRSDQSRPPSAQKPSSCGSTSHVAESRTPKFRS